MSVQGTVIQTTPYETYEPGICTAYLCTPTTPTVSCNEGDWQSGTRSCGMACPDQPICSKPNPNICPNFNNLGPTSVNFTSAPTVQCNYDVNQFTNSEDIVRWQGAFGKNESYNQVIMPSFCSKPTTVGCPKDEFGNPMTACSNFKSTSAGGLACQEWALMNPIPAEAAMTEYCQKTNGIECGCINREQDLEYRSFKQYVPNEPASCWYTPCTKPGFQLIPPSLQNAPCATDTCKKINDGYTNLQHRFLTYDDASAATICSLTPLPTTPPQTMPSWVWWLIGLLLLGLILLLGYYFFRGNRPKTPTEEEATAVFRSRENPATLRLV